MLLINGTPLSFSISQFEHVTGSSLADAITGDSGDNILLGGNGNDTLNGGADIDMVTAATSTPQLLSPYR